MTKVARLNKNTDEFRIHMYDQLWNNINRHILTVWQSIAAVGGALAILVFTEKNPFHLDVALTMIVILSAWLLSHVYDAQQWYDRNLGLIIGIEQHFLAADSHEYMKQPRRFALIGHLRIQRDLGLAMLLSTVGFHFYAQILPVVFGSNSFAWQMILPYIATVLVIVYVRYQYSEWKQGYEKAYRWMKAN